MRHSVEELISKVHEYFPREMLPNDPRYEQTPEVLRQYAARVPASAKYEEWRAMLRRLRARFPQEQFPGVEVHNESLLLQSPTAAIDLDRCFTGRLKLPVRTSKEKSHSLWFYISFVMPYYFILSASHVYIIPPVGKFDGTRETSFDLTPDEVPFVKAIAEEIQTTFPGYEPMPKEVGLTVVPDVQVGGEWFGEATIFHCLFANHW
jgi:hypothetical protein